MVVERDPVANDTTGVLQGFEAVIQDVRSAPKPHTAIVDLGYRGVEVPGVEIIHPRRIKSLSAKARRLAQTPSGGGTGNLAPEGRLRTTAELAQRDGGRCAAPGIVCRRVQPALADAGGSTPGAESPFCTLAPGRDTRADAQ